MQEVKDNIAFAIKEMYAAATLAELRNVKALKGGKTAKDAYRMRIDDYRICFYYRDNIIELVRVLPRKVVYRYFP